MKITDTKKAEAFADALVQSANEPKRELKEPLIPSMTDVEEIRELMSKRFPELTGNKTIYFTCAACRYTFASDEKPERCPDCGKLEVRDATQDEITAYIRVRKEIAQEEN